MITGIATCNRKKYSHIQHWHSTQVLWILLGEPYQDDAALAEEENAIKRVNAQAAHFPAPLLILIGGADRNSSPEASKTFFQRVTLSDKELHEYAGAYTNLLSDSVTKEVLSDIDKWLDAHM